MLPSLGAVAQDALYCRLEVAAARLAREHPRAGLGVAVHQYRVRDALLTLSAPAPIQHEIAERWETVLAGQGVLESKDEVLARQ